MSDEERRALDRALTLEIHDAEDVPDLRRSSTWLRLRRFSRHDREQFDEQALVTGTCKHCKQTRIVRLESSCTMYHWDGKGEDPNASVPLCARCAEEHYEHWDEMWDSYYGGLL